MTKMQQIENGAQPFDPHTLPPLTSSPRATKRGEALPGDGTAVAVDGAKEAKQAQQQAQSAPCTEHHLTAGQVSRRGHLLDATRCFLTRAERDLSAAWERNDVAAATEADEDANWAADLLDFAEDEGRT